MTGQTIQDISYAFLKLALFKDKVDVSSVSIFREESAYCEPADIHIRAAIIGTSHFVQFMKDDVLFTEMLACDAEKDFDCKKLLFSPLTSISETVNSKDKSYAYRFNHQVMDLDENKSLIKERWETLSFNEPLLHLSYDFNKKTKFPAAETKISINCVDTTISVHTVHEYQEENKVVWTESQFSIV